jgi:hypothetical protein
MLPPSRRGKAPPANLSNWGRSAHNTPLSDTIPPEDRPEHGLDQRSLPCVATGSSMAMVENLGPQDLVIDFNDTETDEEFEAWLDRTFGLEHFGSDQ